MIKIGNNIRLGSKIFTVKGISSSEYLLECNEIYNWVSKKNLLSTLKKLNFNFPSKLMESKRNYGTTNLLEYKNDYIKVTIAEFCKNDSYNLNESTFYGHVNWQNNMDALGNVPATIGHNLFATMFPFQFLKLCPKYSYGDDDWFDNQVNEKTPYGIPFLKVDVDKKNKQLIVTNHEGRHRVASIERKNPNVDIPVAILYNKDRYILPDIITLRKKWSIVSENGTNKFNIGQFSLYNEFPQQSQYDLYNIYKENLNEEYKILYKGEYLNKDLIYAINPTKRELYDLIKESPYKELRGFFYNNKLYCWDSSSLTHCTMIEKLLGIKNSDESILQFMIKKDGFHTAFSNELDLTVTFYKSYLKRAKRIENTPELMKYFPNSSPVELFKKDYEYVKNHPDMFDYPVDDEYDLENDPLNLMRESNILGSQIIIESENEYWIKSYPLKTKERALYEFNKHFNYYNELTPYKLSKYNFINLKRESN